MRLVLIIFFFIGSLFAKGNRPNSLYRTNAEVIGPKSLEFQLYGSMFSTLATINEAGVENALDLDQAFSMIDGGVIGRYCLKIPLELRVGMNGRIAASTDPSAKYTASGLESYMLGARYAFTQGKSLKYSLDVEYKQTTYTNTLYTSAPASYEVMELGDGGQEFSFGLHVAYYRSRSNSIAGSAIYRLPANSLSPEVLYNLEIAWALRNVAFFVGTDGIYSLGQSEYTTSPGSRPVMNSGVSELFNSVNRARIDPYVGLNIGFSSIRLSLKGSYTLSGNSTDKGYSLLGSITWTGKGKKEGHKEKIKTFKEYEIEASVIKVSPRGKFVKIDQGMAHDVEKGMRFDIYKTDYFGGNILVASGYVYEVGAGWAIVKISKKYRQMALEKGFYARGI